MAISRVGSERKLRRRSRCQLVVGLVFAAQASGQQAAPVWQLQFDNDLIAIRGAGPPPDYDYTHGSHLAFSWSDQSLVLAQEIYTPRHNEPSPVAGDRPYAASLFGGYAYRKLAGSSLGTFALRAGVTGPPALGEQVQNGVHRLLGNQLEQGWAHQIPTRLVLAAHADETRLLASSSAAAPSRLAAATVGATFGTMQRTLRAGLQTYLGFGAVRSPTADAPLVARPGHWYVLAASREDAVFYDGFIEQSPRNAAVPGARKRTWVGEAAVGIGCRTNRFTAEYRHVVRGREYEAEPSAHAYGSITVSLISP